MKVKLLGKTWNLVFRKGMADCGDCADPNKPEREREIRIREGQRPKAELQTIIHECLHATDWHKDEDSWVRPVANEIGEILWRLGWRKAE